MKIDRQRVIDRFQSYTADYDAKDPKIALKIGHTYRVAALCERIARSEGMDGEDADLAWLLGMLHDIGRFEQLRRYDTFVDAISVDHAQLGADLLFGEEKLAREFICEQGEDYLIETAVRVHSAYRVPADLDKRVETYCHILRDADKIDILRVNVETPLEDIYNTTTEILYHAELTDAVVESFYEHHATLRSIKKTPVDNVAGHISLIFELVFPESLVAVEEQGYWEKLISFPSENPKTKAKLEELKAEMIKYLESKRKC